MAQEFKLPELGENIEAGDVVSVLVNEGDVIEEDQSILELETDKATVEVPSNVSGKVTEIHVSAGDSVQVGDLILSLGETGEKAEASPEEEEKAEQKTEAEAGTEPSEETEEKEAPEPEEEKPEKKEEKPERKSAAEVVDFREHRRPSPGERKLVPASPAVRRFAREIGVDIARVEGSGPKGRISIDDVKAVARKRSQEPSAEGAGVLAAVELPDLSKFGEVRREGFSNVRRATARHLANAWAQVVHVTNHETADVTGLEETRKRHADRVEAEGGKLTVTAIAVKLAVAALKRFPKFNASIDVKSEEVVYKHYFHIGVAVDTDRGLLVPVIRDVDQKNLIDLSIEIKEVAGRAREGKISLDELQGGCFTITNLGGIGGTSFTPIVNFPEVAILGLSRTRVQPVYRDGEWVPRKLLPLSLSYDHRLIDGADAARFLSWFVQALEDPFLLLLEG